VQRLELPELLHARTREHPLGDVCVDRCGGIPVVAEEVADGLVRHVRPAFRVDDVPYRLGRDKLRDRRHDDRIPHLGAYPADLVEHSIE
jgi:hypothetical protein